MRCNSIHPKIDWLYGKLRSNKTGQKNQPQYVLTSKWMNDTQSNDHKWYLWPPSIHPSIYRRLDFKVTSIGKHKMNWTFIFFMAWVVVHLQYCFLVAYVCVRERCGLTRFYFGKFNRRELFPNSSTVDGFTSLWYEFVMCHRMKSFNPIRIYRFQWWWWWWWSTIIGLNYCFIVLFHNSCVCLYTDKMDSFNSKYKIKTVTKVEQTETEMGPAWNDNYECEHKLTFREE